MLPEKAEWKLAGQTLAFTLPLSESISSLKAKIQEETNMPPAKQKLFYDVSLIRDFQSQKVHVYCRISGDVLQGFKHFGLLQCRPRCGHSAASQGERWKEEVNVID